MKNYLRIFYLFLFLISVDQVHGTPAIAIDVAKSTITTSYHVVGDVFTRTYYLFNTEGEFNGQLYYESNWQPGLKVKRVTFSSTGCTVTIPGGGIEIIPSSNTGYSLDVVNFTEYVQNPTPGNLSDNVIITEELEVIGCLGAFSSVALKYCDGGNCNFVVNSASNGVTLLNPSVGKPIATGISTTIADPKEQRQDGCFNDPYSFSTGDPNPGKRTRQVTFNTGNIPLLDFYIEMGLQNNGHNMFAYIPKNSLQIYSGSLANNITNQFTINATKTYSGVYAGACIPEDEVFDLCFIRPVVLNTVIPANQTYILVYDEYYCCPLINDFTKKESRNWILYAQGRDHCSNIVSNLVNGAVLSVKEREVVDIEYYYMQRPLTLFSERNKPISDIGLFGLQSTMNINEDPAFHYLNLDFSKAQLMVVMKLDDGLRYIGEGSLHEFPLSQEDQHHEIPYDKIHFRMTSDATKQWHYTSYDNNYTTEVGTTTGLYKRGYSFLFNLDDSPEMAIAANPRESFLKFMNNAELLYSLEPECTPLANSRYKLEFYILPNPECSECRIPIDNILETVAVMCPGCVFPGGAGRDCRLTRKTLGRPDSDNNMLPEGGTLTGDPNLQRLNFGILGDKIEFSSKAYLTSPSECGINEIVSDNEFGPLKYAYLRMFIKDGIPDEFGDFISYAHYFNVIQSDGVDVILSRQGIQYPMHISSADLPSVIKHFPTTNSTAPIFIDLSLVTLSTLGYLSSTNFPGASDGTYRYMSGDEVEVKFSTEIVINTQSGRKFDNLKIYNDPIFSTQPDLSNGVSMSLLQLDCENFAAQMIEFADPSKQNFLCESYYEGFNLVGLYSNTSTDVLLDYSPSDSRNGCVKNMVYSNEVTLGKDVFNIFKNEFREVPLLSSFDFTIPTGYEIIPNAAYVHSSLYTKDEIGGIGFQKFTQNVSVDAVPNGVVGTDKKIKVELIHIPITTNQRSELPVQILDGDEYSKNSLSVFFAPICTEVPSLILFPDFDDDAKRPKVSFNQYPPFETPRTENSSVVSRAELTKPAATLDLQFDGTGATVFVGDLLFEKVFNITNTNTFDAANNPYVILNFDPSKILNPEIFDVAGGSALTIVASGADYRIYELRSDDRINPGERFYYRLQGSYSCVSVIEETTMNFVYGWDCTEYPTSPAASTCFSNSANLLVSPSAIEYQQKITGINNSTCNTLAIHYNLIQDGMGAMDKIILHVDLPPGLMMNTSSISIGYGSYTEATLLDHVQTIDAANGRYDVVLKSFETLIPRSPFRADGISENELDITISAFFNGECGVYNSTVPISMSFSATSYCGALVTSAQAVTATSLMTFCGNLSMVVSPSNTVCPGTGVVLTANGLPSGTTFEWSKNSSVILGVTSNQYSFVAGATAGNEIYKVRVNDGTSCEEVSQTISIVPNPIVDFTTPPEYCFGTTYPLNGTPSGGVFTGAGVSLVGAQYQFSSTTATAHSITYTYTDPTTGCVGTITKVITPSGCCPYRLDPINVFCGTNDIHCVQLRAVRPVSDGIKGMDFVLRYNEDRLTPVITGGNLEVTFGNVVLSGINPSMVDIAYNIMPQTSSSNIRQMHLSIFYNSNAPATADWDGIGEVVCIKFRINGTAVGDLTNVRIGVMNSASIPVFGYTDEEHSLSTQTRCVENNGLARIEVIQNPMLNGIVRFHNTSSTLKYDAANPTSFNLTTIATSSNTCTPLAPGVSTTPDMTGAFSINMTGTQQLIFGRDIAGDYSSANCNAPATDLLNVMTAMNGYDSYLMESISTLSHPTEMNLSQDRGVPDPNGAPLSEALRKATFPTPYQMIAADVNMNGSIRANDITWLQQRSVSKICEFPQAWNYTEATNPATPVTPGLKSYDWRFTNKSGTRSSNYPLLGGATSADFFTGYWRDKVPVTAACITFPVVGTNPCRAYPTTQEIYAVLLGDIDGSWRESVSHQNTLRTASDNHVVLDYAAMIRTGNSTYRIPVSFDSEDSTVSLDFVLNYDEHKMKILSVENAPEANDMGARMIFNDFNASELALTSFTMSPFHTGRTIYYLDVLSLDGNMDASYLGSGAGFLNGRRVPLHIEGIATSTTDANTAIQQFEVVPNPSNGVAQINYNVISDMEAQILIYNNLGQIVSQYEGISGSGSISLESLNMANGMYQAILKHSNKQEVIKIVVSK